MIRAILEKLACRHSWEIKQEFRHTDNEGKIRIVTQHWVCGNCGKIRREVIE